MVVGRGVGGDVGDNGGFVMAMVTVIIIVVGDHTSGQVQRE
jgi:hypothetical protein